MATINCVVEISKDGEVVDRFPSTNKTFAKQIGKTRATKAGGTFEVKPIAPREFSPAEWK